MLKIRLFEGGNDFIVEAQKASRLIMMEIMMEIQDDVQKSAQVVVFRCNDT